MYKRNIYKLLNYKVFFGVFGFLVAAIYLEGANPEIVIYNNILGVMSGVFMLYIVGVALAMNARIKEREQMHQDAIKDKNRIIKNEERIIGNNEAYIDDAVKRVEIIYDEIIDDLNDNFSKDDAVIIIVEIHNRVGSYTESDDEK